MGGFCKLLKVEKTIANVFNNVFSELKYYQRRSERLCVLILVFQGGLVCIILEYFVNFLDDPYYEPLPWFMILEFL